MIGEHHNLHHEFPEFDKEIHELKVNNHHFKRLMDEHHEIDKTIRRSEENVEPKCDDNVEDLKKQRLKLRDELYQMLVEHKKSS